MSKTELLFLSEKDMIQSGVLDASQCVDVCEEVFRLLHQGDYLMGGMQHNSHGLVIVFPEHPGFPNMPAAGPERRFIAMPAYLGGRFSICGEKWYGSNVKNIQRGLPRSILTITLNDPDTCEPFAYMSGNLVSAMRTGCIPGVAFRYIGNPEARICSFVGTGPVNRATLKAFRAVMPSLEEIVVMARHKEHAEAFCKWAQSEYSLKGTAVDSLEEAVSSGDVVSIAASPSKPLFLKGKWLKEKATVMLTSPIEADDDFWLSNSIVFDNTKMHQTYYEEALEQGGVLKAANGWGKLYRLVEEGRLPQLEEALSLGDIVEEPARKQDLPGKSQIFVTSGQVVFDLAWAYTIYRQAVRQNFGQRLRLWEEPYWV